MELTSFLQVAAFTLLAALPTVHAGSTYYDIPWNMTAGDTYNVTIDQKVEPGSENARRADAYRVYLALTPPGWGTGPSCWLQYLIPVAETQVNITIPPDVVPDKTRIRLSTVLVNSKRPRNPTTGFDYSGRSIILGANGTWGKAELDGRSMGNADEVSCVAYSCVRDCYDQYWKGDKDDDTFYEKSHACSQACTKDLNPSLSNAVSLNGVSIQNVLTVGMVIGFVHFIGGAC